jgi:TolB-like protein/Tfp pilus assembly protein PilF
VSEISDRLAAALVDRYRIERELGEGGMATVYLAHDLKHDRDVAIKVLKPELAAMLGADRFFAEIKTTAQLQHPHILPLFDSGEADGFLYYVMPYVEGETLSDKLNRETRLGVDEAVRITMEVADALDYAHRHGVIHRDIKPENILLDDDHALVTDFGIALAVVAAGAERLTQTGVSVGTPLYMSPEQASADQDMDGRSDLYSLASVLFEMLAGQPPFSGTTVQAILVQRFTQPPPKLSAVRSNTPPRLEAALTRAMARNPADRFAGVAAFAQALAAAPARTTAPEASIAVLPFANMSGNPEDEYFSDGVSDEITNVLSRLGGLRVAARTSAFAFKGTRQDLRVVGEKLGVATVLEGSVRRAGNRVRVTVQLVDVADGYQLWSERFDRELTDIFAIQDEIAEAVAKHLEVALGAGPAGRAAAGTTNLEAYDLYLRGLALQLQRGTGIVRARDVFERAVELDPEYVDALAMLADSSRLLGVYAMAPPHDVMPRAKAAAEGARHLEPDHAEALATLADVSMVYEFDEAAAAAYWERALASDPGHTRARAERALWWMGFYHGRFDEAIAECARAVEADPLNAWAAGMHAIVLGAAGRSADAEREASRALTLDADSFLARWALHITRLWGGDLAGSIAAAQPALAMSGRSPYVLGFLAEAYAAAGQKQHAVAIDAELEARAVVEYVAASFRAAAALATGEVDRALNLLQLAVEQRDGFVLLSVRRPLWEPLRTHLRFTEIMAPTGLTSTS